MPCFRPWSHKPYADRPSVTLACGQCRGCRSDRARAWGVRIAHEASLHAENAFLTLTYSDQHYPDDGSVDVRPLQLFMKRFRTAHPELKRKLRFFAVGEYGERNWRAHFHCIVFGYGFPDRKLWKVEGSGHPQFLSAELTELWPHGLASLGNVSYQTGAYVAGYSLKKINGERAASHYQRPHPITGEIVQLRPEFVTMSRRPGVGSVWFDRFAGDAFPSDFLIVDGKRVAVPPYYLRKLKASETSPNLLKHQSFQIKNARVGRAAKHADNNTPERLAVREEVAELRAKLLRRELEEEL